MAAASTTKLRNQDGHRQIVQPSEYTRQRALARLYERRMAVGNLISALERYQQMQQGLRAKNAATSAAGMSS
jgi:predicted DNA-binding ribbon-helix-helix protein